MRAGLVGGGGGGRTPLPHRHRVTGVDRYPLAMKKQPLSPFNPDSPFAGLPESAVKQIEDTINHLGLFMTTQPDDGNRLSRFQSAAKELISGTLHAALLDRSDS